MSEQPTEGQSSEGQEQETPQQEAAPQSEVNVEVNNEAPKGE